MRGRKITQDKIKEIKRLRENGYSLLEISKELTIPKTTVFFYMKQYAILPEFLLSWKQKRGGGRITKFKKEENAYKEARNLINNLSSKEKLLFLSALYWGEGSKKDFGLSNTDPKLIAVYIGILRDVLGIKNDQLRISIRIYEDLDKNTCLEFWSSVVRIPKKKFINVNVLLGKKKGKLPYGMCRVRVSKGGDLLKKLMNINKVVAESFSI